MNYSRAGKAIRHMQNSHSGVTADNDKTLTPTDQIHLETDFPFLEAMKG